MFGSQKIPVYCHMGNFGCGDGGWTLAMKIDGTKVQTYPRTDKLVGHFIGIKTKFSLLNFRELSILILISGATKIPITLQEARLGLTHKRPSYRATGTRPSPRSVLE